MLAIVMLCSYILGIMPVITFTLKSWNIDWNHTGYWALGFAIFWPIGIPIYGLILIFTAFISSLGLIISGEIFKK